MFENPPVTGQDDPLLFQCQLHYLVIAGIIPIKGIETKQTQTACQFPEVNIEDELSWVRQPWG